MLVSAEKRLVSRCWRPIVSAAFSQNNNPSSDDHYKTLGVRKGASLEDIKHAYRDLSKKYHPDVCKDHDSEERFKKISVAYNTLKAAIKEGRFGTNTFYNDGKRRDYEQAGTTTTYKYKSAGTQARSNTTSSSRSTNYSKQAEEDEVKSKEYDEIYKEWEKKQEKGDEMLYERIFKKTFKEDPAYFYKAENAHLRKEFEEEMAKRKAERGDDIDESDAEWERKRGWDPESEAARREYHEEHRRYDGSRSAGAASMQYDGGQQTGGASDQTKKILGASLALATAFFGYMFTHERNKSNAIFEKSKNLASDDLDKVRDNFLKREEEKREKIKLEFQDSLALMKKYPRRNPNAISMLVDYTIWNDLKLFSVPWTYFHGQDEDLTEKTNEFEKNRIHNIKLNTSVTLALESERVLKNVFVKVDDVMKSLQETGHYEAPGVFFRYYGYIYLKIRRKPIVAENLKECLDNKEKYISVFDLYFKYSTPILMANNEYYEIPLKHHAFIKDTTTREGLGWVGSAHVNHRPIEKKFYDGKDKNVFMWKGPVETNFAQQRYLRAWGVHYPVYHKV